ncbi:hypothetical protein [Streptomyces sp. NPDC007088]|uniref:hypothetical protein n=1 Tax=Streptomyces sp. NPDC007088 TaxID=3364773 RepID=UPI0036C88AE3
MNRLALGIALGVGYLLGRTKKAKLAFAIGTAVAGQRRPLTFQGVSGVVADHLREPVRDYLGANPQYAELLDQMRDRAGDAAHGLLTRTIEGLADHVQDRADVLRDRTAGG